MKRFKIQYKQYLKIVLAFTIGILVALGIGYAAAIFFNSDAVSYNNTNSTLTSTDVQGALDELITKCWTRDANYCPPGQYCEESFKAQFPDYENINTLCTTGENTGAYIDTGVVPTSHTGFFIEFKPRKSTNETFFLGASKTTNIGSSTSFYADISQQTLLVTSGTSAHIGQNSISNHTRYALYYKYLDDNYFRFYGTRETATALPNSINRNIYLFTLNAGGSPYPGGSHICVARFMITENDSLVRNYVACRRKADGKLGLCDEVTGTFNYGVGTFTYD